MTRRQRLTEALLTCARDCRRADRRGWSGVVEGNDWPRGRFKLARLEVAFWKEQPDERNIQIIAKDGLELYETEMGALLDCTRIMMAIEACKTLTFSAVYLGVEAQARYQAGTVADAILAEIKGAT
jgi:hypothetical protein